MLPVKGHIVCVCGVCVCGVCVCVWCVCVCVCVCVRIQRGDMLLEVANRATVGVSLEEATRMLREAAEDVK